MASCEVFYSPQPRGGKPCVARPGSTPGGPRGDLRAARLRPVSVGRQGWGAWWVALRRQEPCSTGRVVPEAWPAVPSWEEDAHEPQQAMPQAAGGRRRAPLSLLVCKHRPINGLEKTSPSKRGTGRMASAQCARVRASCPSVFANGPVAWATSRTWRGLTTTTGRNHRALKPARGFQHDQRRAECV